MNTLTLSERNKIRAIRKHMATVDYASYSGTAIRELIGIIDRLTHCEDCKGSGYGGLAKTPEGDWIHESCPTCGGSGKPTSLKTANLGNKSG